MKSQMVELADYIEKSEKEKYSELQVLQSAAGYYIGTIYTNSDGFKEPGSRDSDYFVGKDAKEKAEKYLEYLIKSDDNDFLRTHP